MLQDKVERVLVRVIVPVSFEVSYIISVKDASNIEEIQEQMRIRDASLWETDPQFYERLGDDFDEFVKKITQENIERVTEKVSYMKEVSV
ncbi:MAG: hypothetical protein O8C67_09605 [Candidatus Methanoperedens sp.]|nr:hypothetical protein [Candidatus Methanoperedens sp.]